MNCWFEINFFPGKIDGTCVWITDWKNGKFDKINFIQWLFLWFTCHNENWYIITNDQNIVNTFNLMYIFINKVTAMVKDHNVKNDNAYFNIYF